MRLVWSTQALDSLLSHTRHIQEENPIAARQIAEAIRSTCNKLLIFPNMGRPGEEQGTRELVIPPYIVVYRVTGNIVELLFVYHGAQDWK